MKRVFKVTRGQRFDFSKPYWVIDELDAMGDYTKDQVFTDNEGKPIYVTIVVEDEDRYIYESDMLGWVMYWGADILCSEVKKKQQQTNNVWRDELGQIQLSKNP